MGHRGWVVLAALVAAISSAGRRPLLAATWSGAYRASGGLTWIPDNPLTQDARARGWTTSRNPTTLGPLGIGTFGYWFDRQHFVSSLEGGYQHDGYRADGMSDLTLDSEMLMATARWGFIGGYNFWPYIGASFGYSFNNVSAPLRRALEFMERGWLRRGRRGGLGLDLSRSASEIDRSSCATPWPCCKPSSLPRSTPED